MPPSRSLADLLRAFAARWSAAGCATHAAALSFYTAFSLAPILVIIVAVGSRLADAASVTQTLLAEVERFVGTGGAQVAAAMLQSAAAQPRGWYAAIASLVLLVTATTAFAELKASLDDVIDPPAVRTSPTSSWLSTLRTRALSFGLVLTLALLLLASLTANAIVRAGGDFVAAQFGWTNASLLAIGAEAVSCVGTLVLFFTIYRILPTRPFGTRSALLAAAATTALFTVGRLAIGYYLGQSTASLAFGPGASLAIVMLWVYYAALVFLAGAVLTVEFRLAPTQPVSGAPRAGPQPAV